MSDADVSDELDRIAALPLAERASAFAALHERLTAALDTDPEPDADLPHDGEPA